MVAAINDAPTLRRGKAPSRTRTPRCVFRFDDTAVRLGLSVDLVGCPFVLLKGCDRSDLNRYLEDCFLGRWRFGMMEETLGQRLSSTRYRLEPDTVVKKAHHVNNFLCWLETPLLHDGRPIAITEVVEEHLDLFAEDMEDGSWSLDGKALSDGYIGITQSDAIDFLQWCSIKGIRDPISLRTEHVRLSVAKTQHPGVTSTKRYIVLRRADPRDVDYPSPLVVDRIVTEISDIALRIGGRLIFECGLRACEVRGLRAEDVPTLKDNLLRNPEGAGSGHFRVVGKGKFQRLVPINADLTRAIDEYRGKYRELRLTAFRKEHSLVGHAGEFLPNELLLDDHGRPLHYKAIWRAIRNASEAAGCPTTPHLGRHWYAMHFLLRYWRVQENLARTEGLPPLSTSQVPDLVGTQLVALQANLGHKSIATTQRYLVALARFLSSASLSHARNESLDQVS
jgi:integrase